MKKELKNKKWMYALGGLVFLMGLLLLWYLNNKRKSCNCKESGLGSGLDKGGIVSKGGTDNAKGSDDVGMTVEELKEILITKGNSECRC